MCRKATPKKKIISCDRCGGPVNPNDGWEYDWPLSGRVQVFMHSRLPDYLSGTHRNSPKNFRDPVKALIKFGMQDMTLQWGIALKLSKNSREKAYRLCTGCHELFLRLLGMFFFEKPKSREMDSSEILWKRLRSERSIPK